MFWKHRVKQNKFNRGGVQVFEKVVYVKQSHVQEKGEVCIYAHTEKVKDVCTLLKVVIRTRTRFSISQVLVYTVRESDSILVHPFEL